jgi:hypothetical protein
MYDREGQMVASDTKVIRLARLQLASYIRLTDAGK